MPAAVFGLAGGYRAAFALAIEHASRGSVARRLDLAHEIVHAPASCEGGFERRGGLLAELGADRGHEVVGAGVGEALLAGVPSDGTFELVAAVDARERFERRARARVDERRERAKPGKRRRGARHRNVLAPPG